MLHTKEVIDNIGSINKDTGQKSWDFPKFGMLAHVFPGIQAKGVTSNYNTKPNEHVHKWTRHAYMHGNKKNVDKQVCIH
jgi:hypothetical protein